MKKHPAFIMSFLSLFIVLASQAQVSDPEVLMTVGPRPVTLMEFKSMYYKNLPKDSIKNQKALDNYLKLFTDFRLKVNAALDARLDTTSSFKQEMKEYRQKLAEPYMRDADTENKLVKEAYDRSRTDIHAAHILIKVGPEASPQDTMLAYKKITTLRERIVKKEITFEAAAKENSEDTYSKNKGGDLGFFTSMVMVYPFENAAFSTKPGEISQPIRTQFGYHIVKVLETRPDPGQIQVAHIMLRTPPHLGEGDSAKFRHKIDSIYGLLKSGQDFADLARKFSQDPGTGRSGGVLPWFGVGRMPAEFEAAAFALKKPGDYSAPIRTNFGWHIIKLLATKPAPAFDSVKESLTARVLKDQRSQLAVNALVEMIKKKYAYKEMPEGKKDFYKVIDESFYSGKWTVDKAKDLTGTIFSLGTDNIPQQDFALFLSRNQMVGENKGGEYAVNALYPKFVKEQCLKFWDESLESVYPGFAEMLLEYRDGILLFDITDKMVWSKALKDTTGLKAFFEQNKKNYMWPDRVEVSTYTCADAKTAKEVKKLVNDKKSGKEIVSEVNAKDPKAVSLQSAKYEKSDKGYMEPGVTESQTKDGKPIVINAVTVPAGPKTLDEARGLVTTDYQNYLMTQWLSDLRAKYPVHVNAQVLAHVMPQ